MARPRLRFALLACALMALASTASAQGDNDEPRGVELSELGIERLVIGGQVRVQAEHRTHRPPIVGAPSQSPMRLLAQVNATAWFTDHVYGFVETQAQIASQGVGSNGQLHQAFVQLDDMFGVLGLQAGRFEMRYGNERMVSALYYSQVLRAWDGARVMLDSGEFAVDLLATMPVRKQGGVTGDEQFYGLYGEWNGEPAQLDAYVFRRKDDTIFLDDYTVGGLFESSIEPVSVSVETAIQRGDRGPLSVSAFALSASVSVDVGGPRLGAGFDWASGDSNPADAKLGTFTPLFNRGHFFQGLADIFDWRNLQDIVLSGTMPLDENWTAQADLHLFRVDNTNDAIYPRFGAGTLVASGARRLGTEIDFTVRTRLEGGLDIWTGVAYFSAGPAIVGGSDSLWAFLQLALTF